MNKPLAISTGASHWPEVEAALAAIGPKGAFALLQCASMYPSPLDAANLAAVHWWLGIGFPAGLSDHALDLEASIAAISLGARMIERHMTIDRSLPGGDNSISSLPEDFRLLSEAAAEPYDPEAFRRLVNSPLWGSPLKAPHPLERPDLIRRAAVAARDLKRGEKLEDPLIKWLRPPGALSGPALAPYLGPPPVLSRSVPKGAVVLMSDLAPGRFSGMAPEKAAEKAVGRAPRKAVGQAPKKSVRIQAEAAAGSSKEAPSPAPAPRERPRVAIPAYHLLASRSNQGEAILKIGDGIELKSFPEPPWLGTFDGPRIAHLAWGLCEGDFQENFRGIGAMVRKAAPELLSLDLGPACESRLGWIPLSPILSRQKIVEKAKSSLGAVRRFYDGPVAAENYNYYPTGLYESVCRPDFIGKLLESLDLSLCLDLAHAAISAHSLKIDFRRYLGELPLSRVAEIHVSRPFLPKDPRAMAADAHGPPEERELQWLVELLANEGLWSARPGIPQGTPPWIVVEHYGPLEMAMKGAFEVHEAIAQADKSWRLPWQKAAGREISPRRR